MSQTDDVVNRASATNRSTVPRLRLNARLDPAMLAPVFQRYGRIHVPAVLDRESASAVHAALAGDVPWQTHYNDGQAAYDIPSNEFHALDATVRERLLAPIHARARDGFQYFYENFSLADHHDRGEHLDLPLMRVFEFLRSEPVLEYARRVTGIREIVTVDAQATCYRAGHFLTAHDDRDEKKGRVAAYVLNLTPRWRADWGGILHFFDDDGHVAEGYVPAFNAINLFRVPARHAVSVVAPFAGGARLSITGWFRRF